MALETTHPPEEESEAQSREGHSALGRRAASAGWAVQDEPPTPSETRKQRLREAKVTWYLHRACVPGCHLCCHCAVRLGDQEHRAVWAGRGDPEPQKSPGRPVGGHPGKWKSHALSPLPRHANSTRILAVLHCCPCKSGGLAQPQTASSWKGCGGTCCLPAQVTGAAAGGGGARGRGQVGSLTFPGKL